MDTQPIWWRQLVRGFESGSNAAFILHGNTRDYVVPGVGLSEYLAQAMANREILAFFNPATGFTFPIKSHEQRALKLIEPVGGAAQPNAMAALMGGGGAAGPATLPREGAAALDAIDQILRADISTVVVIEYADKLWPETSIATTSPADRKSITQALEWGRKGDKRELQNALILVADGGIEAINGAMRRAESGYKALRLPKPDEALRCQFITDKVQDVELVMAGITEEQLARATAGLSLLQIEDMLLQANFDGELTSDAAKRMKDAMIEAEYAGLVEIIEPQPEGFAALGGKDGLKEWFRTEVVDPVLDGRRRDVPKGVILAGPPGTGKTYALACLAGEIGFNVVALDAGKLQASYVGETQARLRRVFDLADTLAPVIMFMDEIDQSNLSSRGQGSGNPVAADMFNMMLKFMSDDRNRGRVIFIGATNRPDLMDSAFMRSGRIDAIIPVLVPDERERAAIITVQASLQETSVTAEAIETAVMASEKWSGADLQKLVRQARKSAGKRRSEQIETQDIAQAVRGMRPDTSQVEFYQMLAIRACTEIGLLPDTVAGLTYAEIDSAIDQSPRRDRSGRKL